jgi:hypothetical protein
MGKPKPKAPGGIAPIAEVRRWFDLALQKTDPRPLDAAYQRLAREFQILVNRQNNVELERPPAPAVTASKAGEGRLDPASIRLDGLPAARAGILESLHHRRQELKDVSPAEELDKRVRNVMAAANQLMAAANALEDWAGGYQWTDEDGHISLVEVKDILQRIGAAASGMAYGCT